MKILVTNDDGTNATGLWVLARQLQAAGRVTVVAPDRENSGVGSSVSLHTPVRINRLLSPLEGVDSYSVEGTPADAAILGINLVMRDGVDLIVSGVNHGRNLGNDVFISGTVGAATQGRFHDIPSIAVSVTSYDDVDYGPAARLCAILARKFESGALPRKAVLNINFPNLALPEIAGIAITRLGEQVFGFTVKKWENGKKDSYRIVRSQPAWEVAKGSDHWAVENGYISITALMDYTDAPIIAVLKAMAPSLSQSLKNSV